LISNPNFLILDEPTNDLDIVTLNILEDYLQNFSGCLLIVSHDRYFMDKLVDHLFVFDRSDVIRDFPGNYTDYRLELKQKKQSTQSAPAQVEEKANTKTRASEKKKLTYKEQQEFKKIENDMPKLESRKDELNELLNSGETDHVKLTEWSQEIETVQNDLDEMEMRWLELSEYM